MKRLSIQWVVTWGLVMNKVDIMGTEYTIDESKELKNIDGKSDWTIGRIEICKTLKDESKEEDWKDLNRYRESVLRHEIIHAFFNECGITQSTNQHMHNEEVVDYFAMMMPRIMKAFKEAGCDE